MVKTYLNKLKKSEFFRHSFTLLGGSFVSQIIPVLIAPILTRLFTNEDIGIYFLFSSIMLITTIFSTLQYEMTIVLPKRDKDAVNLLALSIIVSFLISFFLLIVIIIFNRQIISLLGDTAISLWLYFIPPSVFMSGIFQAYNYFGNRLKKYGEITSGKIIKSVFTALTQVPAGIAGYEKAGLIVGLLVGQFFSAFYVAIRFLKYIKQIAAAVSAKRMFVLAKYYKNVPVFNTMISVINKFSNNLPIFLLTRYYGANVVSLFGLSHRVISTPMGLLNFSIGQVFFQQASDIHNRRGDIYAFVKKTYWILIKISIAPFLILTFIAPQFFTFLFGNNWQLSGTITQVLLPWLFLMFLNSPITFIVTILNKQRTMVLYDIFLFIFRFLALYSGFIVFNNYMYSIMLFSLVGFIFNLGLLLYFLHISRQATRSLL